MEADSEFGRLFETFEHTAFRLEVRDRYNVSYEQESFRNFLATGRRELLPAGGDWYDMVRRATAEGRTFRRVRVVPVPLTDYNRFGLAGAQFNNEAGEDIRYLTRDRANAVELPNHDYWLFDSRLLVRMHFDNDDRPVDKEVIEDPAEIVEHNYWRDVAWHHAIRRDDFATEQGLEHTERP